MSSSRSITKDIEEGQTTRTDDKTEVTLTNREYAAQQIKVQDLRKYKGKTLGARVDSFIAEHPVTMITKSWCPFCVE